MYADVEFCVAFDVVSTLFAISFHVCLTPMCVVPVCLVPVCLVLIPVEHGALVSVM